MEYNKLYENIYNESLFNEIGSFGTNMYANSQQQKMGKASAKANAKNAKTMKSVTAAIQQLAMELVKFNSGFHPFMKANAKKAQANNDADVAAAQAEQEQAAKDQADAATGAQAGAALNPQGGA